MDTFSSFYSSTSSASSQSQWNINTLLKMNDIHCDIQQHLVRVYSSLVITLFASIIGVLIDLKFHLGGILSGIVSIGLFIWLAQSDQRNFSKSFGILIAFGFFNGMNIGSLIDLVLLVDPSIIITGLLSTTAIFTCFTFSALLAKRRSYLYLGGILSSAISCMFILSLMNMFFNSIMVFSAQLYIGLFVMCGYVLFDTQVIIEKASMGHKNYMLHAAELFTDFIGIFVRICIILLKNSEKKKDSKRR